MKVRIDKCTAKPDIIGDVIEMSDDIPFNKYYLIEHGAYKGYSIPKSDCTILPDAPQPDAQGRYPFDYDLIEEGWTVENASGFCVKDVFKTSTEKILCYWIDDEDLVHTVDVFDLKGQPVHDKSLLPLFMRPPVEYAYTPVFTSFDSLQEAKDVWLNAKHFARVELINGVPTNPTIV